MNVVVETCKEPRYPSKTSFFRPSQRYLEYPEGWPIDTTDHNVVYECVRNAFIRMGYDKERVGTKEWNPLRNFISPGDTVLVKPNLVEHHNASGDTVECLYTQPGVIAAVLDYVFLALGKSGHVIVGDAPMQECNFDILVEQSGLDVLVNFYKERGFNLSLADFRGVVTVAEKGVVHYEERENVGMKIDLGTESEFSQLSPEELLRLRKGANDPADLHHHHNTDKHEYEVCRELLQADVLIDMPKPKCHKKAGVTISLKNMVGVNVRKEYLPHHTEGDKQTGMGDAYEKRSVIKRLRAAARDEAYVLAIQKKYKRAYVLTQIRRACALITKTFSKDRLTEGTWYGNETISKTVIDLNKIVKYVDKQGNLSGTVQRKRLIVADMIIAGEKEGPLAPTAKYTGAVAVGEDPVCFDECIATLMGAKIEQIPTMKNARNVHGSYSLTSEKSIAVILSNNRDWNEKTWKEISPEKTWLFEPIPSWQQVFYEKKKDGGNKK